jgi:hypothetical protein
MSVPLPATGAIPRRAMPAAGSTPGGDRLVVAAFMAVTIASGIAGAAGYDTTRDVAQALAIRQFDAFPLHGPMFASSFHLGPLWFYVLALPLFVHQSWLSVALFVPALASLQFPLAYAAGRRLADRWLGLLWCAVLALPGWGSFELVGFAHTNVVPACTMLVLYTLVRLTQDRRPGWLACAAAAMSLAVHAHPSTAVLLPIVAVMAVVSIRDAGVLARWGAVALAIALVPFAPLVLEHFVAPSALLRQSGDYVEGMVRLGNIASVPALLYGVLVRGPHVVAAAFFEWASGAGDIVSITTLAVEGTALAGLVIAVSHRSALAIVALSIAAVVAVAIAWIRPVTPFYMTYVLLPPLAAAGAVGLHALCAPFGTRAAAVAVGMLLALHVVTVGGIARTIVSGHVAMPVASRLDIKQDDAAPPLVEPWFPAYAVDASGALLCAHRDAVVLHGTYAFLEDMYLGLDHRLHCAARDVRLLGAMPADATHLVGIARPLWTALGAQPRMLLGGIGVAPAARVLGPATGFTAADGSVYPPHRIIAGPERMVAIEARIPADEALVVSQPYALWMPAPRLRVSINGQPASPLARDAVSAVYACRACPAGTLAAWRIEIESVAPDHIDVVTVDGARSPPRQ